MASLEQIFGWFKRGFYPTEDQYKQTWGSFWHKSERLPQSQVLGLNDALNDKASKGDLANVGASLIYKPEVPTSAALYTTYPDAKTGWAAKVTATGTIWQCEVKDDGTKSWADTGLTAFPSDVVVEPDLIKVKQQLTYQPAFPLSNTNKFTDNFTSYIWCIDYYAETILGLRLKVRNKGKFNLYKVNIRAKSYEFITTIDQPEGEATIQDILFDNPIKLQPYERFGLNGNVYYKTDEPETLKPKMYVINLNNGGLSEQYDAVMAYALITPNDVTHIDTVSNKVESVAFESVKGTVMSDKLIRASAGFGEGGADVLTTASLLQLPSSGEITSLTANVQPNTDIHVVLGELVDGKLYEVDRVVMKSDHAGLWTADASMHGLKGQYLGFYKDTSKFGFRINHQDFDCRFLQFPVPYAAFAGTNMKGWVGLSYTLKSNPTTDVDVNVHGYAKGLFYQGLIAPTSGYKAMNPDKSVTFNASPFSFNGNVKRLWIDTETAGEIKIGVGIIDQRNWAIVDEEYTVNIPAAGLSEIHFPNIALSDNQRLFFKTALSVGYNTDGIHLESVANDIQLNVEADEIIFKYEIEGKRIITSSLASKKELSEVQVQLSNIETTVNGLTFNDLYMLSPDGTRWKQTIDNNGQTAWQKVASKKVSVFGNSFDVHPIMAGLWWSLCGMAATRKEKDWVHQLMEKLMSKGVLATISPCSIAENINGNEGWELNAANFDYSRINPYLQPDTELVIIRIGENNPNTSTLTEDTKTLINYIRGKVPNVPIIFGGVFLTHQAKQAKLKAAVDSFGNIPFIDFQDLDKAEYKSAIGTLVLGDDGVWHEITHAGVANHAGDAGMEAMAERILPYAMNVLK
jgi:hypothetical protein